MLHIDYRDPRPIYEQVKDGLRRLMVTGVIQEGEKLPSVRSLASSLAINPNTIQRSYRQLEAEGWIVTVPGKGCFICSDDRHAQAQKQQLLAEKVGETKKKLDLLKKAQAKLDADGVAKNTEEYRKLQREIIETESKCKSFEGELRGIGNVNFRAAAAQV